MSSDKTPRRSNQEWEQLKALRSYRDRLVNKATYSKLDKSQVLADEIGLENHIDLLENGLRNIMRRHDLDVYFTNGLDREAMDSAKASLKSLCALLERIVNTELLDLGHSEDVEHANLIKYPRLNGLLTRLSDTTWNFTMVSKARWKLFQSDSPEVDKNQVDNINTLFNRLAQLEIGSLQPSEAKTAASNFEICGPRDQFTNALKTLEVLLSRLEKLKNCQGCHKVLLQLPKWDTAASHECFRDTHLELFVSTCHDPQEWQESQLSFLSQRDQNLWYTADELCEDINESRQSLERLDLAVYEREILVSCGAEKGNEALRSRTAKQPSRTLSQLLHSGAFLDTSADIWVPGSRISRFHKSEKRALAAALVISLALTLETKFTTKCWNSEAIYFVAGSDGECARELPYAICTSHPQGDLQRRLNEPGQLCAAIEFPLLARILMEIESGISLEHIPVDPNDHVRLGMQTLEDVILYEIDHDLSKSHISYLEAVQECLRFQQKYQRELKRMARRGVLVDHGAAARRLAHAIVTKIQGSMKVAPHTEATKVSSYDWAPTEINWPAISCEHGQLGLSRGLLKPPQLSTENGDLHLVEGEMTSQKRNVRFMDELDSVEEFDSKGGRLQNRVNIEVDDCELFGDENEQGATAALCSAAKRWTTSFKDLRKRYKIGLAKKLKVAILDTGCDARHPNIQNEVRMAGYKSFVDSDAKTDSSGHGTHIAGILLDLTAENVDLYIAKTFESRVSQDRRPIVEALAYARDVWKVDIISLSFGYRVHTNPDTVQIEIDQCIKAGQLIFASASNDGGDKPRTYPGDYNDVLCIHSATGEGNKSTFNPTPEPKTSKKDNFSIVGDCINSYWPINKANHSGTVGRKYMSGTSIATPVAVSIAAFIIGYVRREMSEYDWNLKPWNPAGMQKIFRMMAQERDTYDWVSPVRYFQKYGDGAKLELKRELRAYRRGNSQC